MPGRSLLLSQARIVLNKPIEVAEERRDSAGQLPHGIAPVARTLAHALAGRTGTTACVAGVWNLRSSVGLLRSRLSPPGARRARPARPAASLIAARHGLGHDAAHRRKNPGRRATLPLCFSCSVRWAVNVDDAHNPWRFLTCPECCDTGHNLDASVRIAQVQKGWNLCLPSSSCTSRICAGR